MAGCPLFARECPPPCSAYRLEGSHHQFAGRPSVASKYAIGAPMTFKRFTVYLFWSKN